MLAPTFQLDSLYYSCSYVRVSVSAHVLKGQLAALDKQSPLGQGFNISSSNVLLKRKIHARYGQTTWLRVKCVDQHTIFWLVWLCMYSADDV